MKNELGCPNVRVDDLRSVIELTLDRYSLLNDNLPFEYELLHAIGQDAAALGLAVGPSTHPLALRDTLRPVMCRGGWTVFLPELIRATCDRLLVCWVDKETETTPPARTFTGLWERLGGKAGLMVIDTDLPPGLRPVEDERAMDLASRLGAITTTSVRATLVRNAGQVRVDAQGDWFTVERPQKRKGGRRFHVEVRSDQLPQADGSRRERHGVSQAALDIAHQFSEPAKSWVDAGRGRPAVFTVIEGWGRAPRLGREASLDALTAGWTSVVGTTIALNPPQGHRASPRPVHARVERWQETMTAEDTDIGTFSAAWTRPDEE